MKQQKKYKQGIFTPINKEKYHGSTPIIWRSSYELLFMRWADSNSNVLSWSSESVVVPYVKPTDGKIHKYFVDNTITLKDPQGNIHKYLIEIKPLKSLSPPKPSKRKKQSTLLSEQITYATNISKWESAKKWAAKKGYKFIILTEKELGIHK